MESSIAHTTTITDTAATAAAVVQVLGRVGAVLGLVAAAGCLGIFIAILAFDWGLAHAVQLTFVVLVSAVPIGLPVVTGAVGAGCGWAAGGAARRVDVAAGAAESGVWWGFTVKSEAQRGRRSW